jgi:hypothetical protein
MKDASTLAAIAAVMEKGRFVWLLRSFTLCLMNGVLEVTRAVGLVKRRVLRRSLEAIVAKICLYALEMAVAVRYVNGRCGVAIFVV